MANQIYPCLWFDGQAKEAAEFYCSAIKNSKIISENPIVVTFDLNGKLFMALNGGPMFKINPSISAFVYCESIEETNAVWNKLIDGGKALMPIDKYPWSERYGWLQDKFGFTWQISILNNTGEKLNIIPSLLFTADRFGKAEEAINFHISVFENSKTERMIHYPADDANAGTVMYAEFRLNNYNLIAMDGPGEHKYSFNEAVSFVVNCDTQDEIDYYWNKFTDGGKESMCGWCQDKFGIWWQVVPTILGKLMSDPEKSEKFVQAFLKMKKFNIETLLNV